MKCPFCGYIDSKVIDSRPTEDNVSIRRRRECISCGKRFTTYEQLESFPLLVVKKDGRRESFDRAKILDGVAKACQKRPVSAGDMERLADDVELSLRNGMEREVRADQIGEMVMERLRALDEVAYVRFASVYRQFKDLNTFYEELNKLTGKTDGAGPAAPPAAEDKTD